MDSMRIEILNPKAKILLRNLADLDLIKIEREDIRYDFKELLKKLRSNYDKSLSLKEISNEVEIVRKARYND